MTKAELIKKYGIEWYEARNVKNKARNKARYNSDAEFREAHKAKCSARFQRSYCKDGQIELIENYELAKTDNFRDWDVHHKLEIHEDYINTKEDLIMMNLYYNRPADELIFLRHDEHTKLHKLKRG